MEILVSSLIFVAVIFQLTYILGVISIFHFFQNSYSSGHLQSYCKNLANTNFLSVYLTFVNYKERGNFSLVTRLTGVNAFSAILRSAVLVGVCLSAILLIAFFSDSVNSSWFYIFALFVLSVLSATFTIKELVLANALKQDYMAPFHTYRNMAAPLVSTLHYNLFSKIDYEKVDEEVFIRENRELLEAYNDIYCNEDDVKSMVVIRKTIYENFLSLSTIIDDTFVTFYFDKASTPGFDFVASRSKDVENVNTNIWNSKDIISDFDLERGNFYVSKVNDTISRYDIMYEEIITEISKYDGNDHVFIIMAPTKDFKEFFNDL